MADIEIIVGSQSDLEILRESKLPGILNHAGVDWNLSILSAHRHSDELTDFCRQA